VRCLAQAVLRGNMWLWPCGLWPWPWLDGLEFRGLGLDTYGLVNINASNNKKGKDSPYSTAERRVPELIRFLAVSLQIT